MQSFIAYLHDAHDKLSDLLDEPREDWDAIIHATDEDLEEMGWQYAMTHNAPLTTPLWPSQIVN